MAEETKAPASEAPAPAEAIANAAEEKPSVKGAAPAPAVEEEPKKPESAEEPAEAAAAAAAAAVDGEKEAKEEKAGAPQSVSLKEETDVVADLQKQALDEFKELVRAALANHEFSKPPPPPAPKEEKPSDKAEDPTAEAPKAEESAAEAPEEKPAEKAEEPAAEAPKEDKLAEKAEEPATEAPKAEEPAAEALKEDTPAEKSEEPTTEAPKAEAAAAEASKSEEPTSEASKLADFPAEASAKVEDKTHAAPAKEEEEAATPPPPPEEVFLWGIPLLGDEKSDTVLLKFLRARDFKAKDALAMLKDAVIWRKVFAIEGLLEEDLGAPEELAKVVFMEGHGREGHPVCYNVYGEFQDRELYQKVLSDEEKRGKFLRWRIQFLEKGIREQLDFGPSGVCAMVQVTDLKNAPGPWKWELRQATKQALALLQDNYPEFVAKQVFINVPWWYLAFNRMISPFLTQRTKSKFVFAGPSKSAETLFKYVAPEQVPVHFGGLLSRDNDADFGTSDAVTEVTIKPSTKHAIEIPVPESCVLVWELRVLGWDVSYGAEFVPSAEDGYTVIVQKARRFAPTDEPLVKNSFKVGEPGKIVLTVDNSASKKKLLLCRSKAKSAAESM